MRLEARRSRHVVMEVKMGMVRYVMMVGKEKKKVGFQRKDPVPIVHTAVGTLRRK